MMTVLERFERQLIAEEKSTTTIAKYVRDTREFLYYIGSNTNICKEQVIAYKQDLSKRYQLTSANSILAAVNAYLRFAGYSHCVVKSFKIQRETFRERDKELSLEEYQSLLRAAKKKGNIRLFFLMQTIAATGIRVSELPFVTVESLRIRRARVSLKGKSRFVILPKQLCQELKQYAKEQKIGSGSIFITRSGRPLDRSNILHEMKSLSKDAKVNKEKIFPHNLRHLFAVTYYQTEQDLCHLADLLGHSNINTTRMYTMVSCEEQERQIDNLGLLA